MNRPLTDDMDAHRWAAEFSKQFLEDKHGGDCQCGEDSRGYLDFDTMRSWFANAIMCGTRASASYWRCSGTSRSTSSGTFRTARDNRLPLGLLMEPKERLLTQLISDVVVELSAYEASYP